MTLEATLLPDTEKEALARSLLEEFGAEEVRVGSYGELIHGCLLPWGNHKDQKRNPTASLNYKKLVYKCLGCGSGGGLLWFIQVMRGQQGEGTKEARRWLERETGTGGQVMDLTKLLSYLDSLYDKTAKDRSPLPTYNERVLEPWKVIHPYLTEMRNIPVEAIVRLKLGYDDNRQRIIIPHYMGDTLVGWQARRLAPDDPDPVKYRNSPDFPKDRSLYNYDYLAENATVVEAPLTVARHLVDIHMEATFGTSVTDNQVHLLSKHHPRLTLWMDNDQSGWTATGKLGYALRRHTSVWVVDSPYAQDAGEIDTWRAKELIEEAIPWSLWKPPKSLRCYVHQSEKWNHCPCPKKG